MLKQGNIYSWILCICFFSCNINIENRGNKYMEVSKAVIHSSCYDKILNDAHDSINHWSNNNLGYYKYCGKSINCLLDTLICFNSDTSRFIGALLKQQLLEEGVGDDIEVFMGERQKGGWFFFSGPTFFILRSTIKDQNIHTPLSYQQLHQMALKEIFSGYLKNGQINEAWFTEHFEHIGWGDFNHQEYDDWCFKGKRYTDISEYYKATHLCKVRSNWASRDTTKPLVPLPAKNLP